MNILKLQQYDINNGDGVRASIWTAGCNHRCKGCWSSSTWNKDQGAPYIELKEDIIKLLSNNNIDGVSILGGDPLLGVMEYNDRDIIDLLKLCKEYEQPVWLWTGFLIENIPKEVISLCSVIIDGIFEVDKKDTTLKYRGSSNQRVINCNTFVTK